jgi:metal-responsive CopG/Arc/MetJ family transcriptional regulator
MKRAAKVAISLPGDLLQRVDRARRHRKVSRSEYFRQAVESLLSDTSEPDLDRYLKGYVAQPETPDEVEAVRAASLKLLASEPWD